MLRATETGVEPFRVRWAVVFEPGEAIVLREVWRGSVFEARPTIVVRDEPEQLTLLLPGGARCAIPIGADGRELRLPDRPWRLEISARSDRPILSFAWPDTPYAVLLWAMADDRRVWYVNLQDPLTRTRIGFDTVDHALDVVVELDGSSWSWKDEEELAEAVRGGLFSAAEAADFREWGERAVDRILAGAPPFDRGWEDWRPDPAWRAEPLREGWDQVRG